MNFETPQREQRELICPNAPIRRTITLFKIKTIDHIENVEAIYKMMNESSNQIIGVKPFLSISSQEIQYFSVMTKMSIYDFKDWIKDINYELSVNSIEFEFVA